MSGGAAAASEDLGKRFVREQVCDDELLVGKSHVEVTVERSIRLSSSKLLHSQTQFYQTWGALASHVAPDYISNNTFIAASYAKVILAYIKDLILNEKLIPENQTSDEITPIPLYIVELGAGTGNLAYLLIRALAGPLQRLFVRKNKKKYPLHVTFVITDVLESNVAYWQEHGYFDEFIKKKVVDFAVFNVLEDDEICLKFSSKILNKTSLKGNPLIFIGNSLLDILPHDAFSVSQEKLSEVVLNYQIPVDVSDPVFLSEALKHNIWGRNLIFPPSLYDGDDIFSAEALQAEQERREKEDGDNPNTRPLPPTFLELIYYLDEEYKQSKTYNQLLDQYRKSFEGENGSFLFPIGACQMFERMTSHFGSSTLYLFGSRGDISLSDFNGLFSPPIGIHGGSITFSVNLHLLKQYWDILMTQYNIEGHVYVANSSHDFKVCMFVGGLGDEEREELTESYSQLNQFSPDDYYRLYRTVNPKSKPSNIHAMIRLSGNDPGMFYQYKDQLLAKLAKSSFKGPIIQELLRMWGNYYHRAHAMDEDIPYSLGEIFLSCDRPDDALPFFMKSIKLSGSFYSTHYNIGLCYEKLGNIENALHHFLLCETSEVDTEMADLHFHIQYVQGQIDHIEKEKRRQEKKRSKLIQQYEKEENRKKKIGSRSSYVKEESQSLLPDPMSSRMSRFSKYGNSTSVEESNAEPEEEEEEEGEEIDDDYAPLCL